MEPARGESCLAGQRRSPATTVEDTLPSPDQISFHIPTAETNRGQKCKSLGLIPPCKVWKPQPYWLVADWLSSSSQRAPHPGTLRSHLLIKNSSISLQFQQTGDQDSDPTGLYRPIRYGNPNSGYTFVDWGSRSQHTITNECKEFRRFVNCRLML